MFYRRIVLIGCLTLFSASGAYALGVGDDGPAPQNCKLETLDFGGREQTAWYCLGEDGVWHAQRRVPAVHENDGGTRPDNGADADTGSRSGPSYGRTTNVYTPPAPTAPVRQVSTTPLDRELDAIVQADSASWQMNRYDSGSMTSTKVLARVHGKPTSLYGTYTFNGGRPGWVRVKLAGGRVSCLSFWDDQACRPLGQSLSLRFGAAIAAAASHPSSGNSSGNSGGSGEPACDANCEGFRLYNQQQNFERDQAAEAPPSE
jgi:hypothetical protein